MSHPPPPIAYPRDLWECCLCHRTFPLDDNGLLSWHIGDDPDAWCPSLRASGRVHIGSRLR